MSAQTSTACRPKRSLVSRFGGFLKKSRRDDLFVDMNYHGKVHKAPQERPVYLFKVIQERDTIRLLKKEKEIAESRRRREHAEEESE